MIHDPAVRITHSPQVWKLSTSSTVANDEQGGKGTCQDPDRSSGSGAAKFGYITNVSASFHGSVGVRKESPCPCFTTNLGCAQLQIPISDSADAHDGFLQAFVVHSKTKRNCEFLLS